MSTIITINAGSSSLKVSIFTSADSDALASVSLEGIGVGNGMMIIEKNDTKEKIPQESADHHEAAAIIKGWLESTLPSDAKIAAASYRVVHGGERFKDATVIDDDVVSYLAGITPLAPNHMPAAVACIEAFRAEYPEILHVACFDTAFFHDIPAVAKTLALPKRLRDQGMRRYGFHGISYDYLTNEYARKRGTEATGRIIIAHLGSGGSMTAVLNGKPIDMTMGLTPASGIVMSTRSGDIDPGVFDFLMKEEGASIDTVRNTLYKESGLLGISETTADMLQLLNTRDEDPRAKLAIEVYTYVIRKYIGAYTAALGGLDAIIFSAGIGERSAPIRGQVLEGLEYLGVFVDEAKNQANDYTISTEESKVAVHVIPTREDSVLVNKAQSLLGA